MDARRGDDFTWLILLMELTRRKEEEFVDFYVKIQI